MELSMSSATIGNTERFASLAHRSPPQADEYIKEAEDSPGQSVFASFVISWDASPKQLTQFCEVRLLVQANLLNLINPLSPSFHAIPKWLLASLLTKSRFASTLQ